MKKDINIRKKVLIFIVTCLIIVFGSLCIYINFIVKPQKIKEKEQTISKMLETKTNEVDAWVNKKAIEYRIISSIPAFSYMDTRQINPLIDRFTNMYMRNGEEMETFSYIGKNGFCWINSDATEDLMDYKDYKRAYESDKEFIIGSPILNENNREVMLFYYPVLSSRGEKEALICSAVPTVGLKEIVNASKLYNGKLWVMNKDKELISENKDYFYNTYLDSDKLEKINLENINTIEKLSIEDVDGNSGKLFLTPVPHYREWYTCVYVKDSIITKSTDDVITGSLILFLILIMLTIILGLVLSNSVMEPIINLNACMKDVEEGNLNSYYDINANKDEIYELGMTYNKMLDRIKELIDKIYQEQNAKRIAELNVLQEQIKPHFLYNTLDNLKWMAKAQGAEDVAKTVTSLSNLFRISLSNGREYITIKEEFKHTKCYLDIQTLRYKEKMTYYMELDKDIEDVNITKIVIQPIVENAIYHGIKPKDTKGCIWVKGYIKENIIFISIRDNGIGIEEEKLEKINDMLSKMDSDNHFGMVNILRRLKNSYGDKADLKIKSKSMVGTEVVITIPVGEESYV